jgi:hypothetical protein
MIALLNGRPCVVNERAFIEFPDWLLLRSLLALLLVRPLHRNLVVQCRALVELLCLRLRARGLFLQPAVLRLELEHFVVVAELVLAVCVVIHTGVVGVSEAAEVMRGVVA